MDSRLQAVQSTNVAGYLYSGGDLIVQFHSDGIYKYSGVPQDVVAAFAAAPSKGTFLNASIKRRFTWQRLSQQDFDAWCLSQQQAPTNSGRATRARSRGKTMTLEQMVKRFPAMGVMF